MIRVTESSYNLCNSTISKNGSRLGFNTIFMKIVESRFSKVKKNYSFIGNNQLYDFQKNRIKTCTECVFQNRRVDSAWVSIYILLFKYDAHMFVLDVVKCPELPLVFKPRSWA